MADLKQRPEDQPLPTPNNRPDIQSMVIADIAARREVGISRYGTALQAFNGRDALQDLYEELLDACMYIRQVVEERGTYKADAEPRGDKAEALLRDLTNPDPMLTLLDADLDALSSYAGQIGHHLIDDHPDLLVSTAAAEWLPGHEGRHACVSFAVRHPGAKTGIGLKWQARTGWATGTFWRGDESKPLTWPLRLHHMRPLSIPATANASEVAAAVAGLIPDILTAAVVRLAEQETP